GLDKRKLVQQFFTEQAAQQPSPPDWCYVHNFDHPHKPRVIKLPAGKGQDFRNDMEDLVEELRTALSAAFESEEYQTRRQTIEQEFRERQAEAFNELQQRAQEEGIALIRTPSGIAIAPVKEGEVLSPEEIQKLSEEEQAHIQEEVATLQDDMQKIIRQVPSWQHEMREKLNELNREMADFAVGGLMEELREKYENFPEVIEHLDAVQKDVVENADQFLSSEDGSDQTMQAIAQRMGGPSALQRYVVNVLVDNTETEGAAVIYEDNPTYQNLVGRVEHRAQMGALFTDFTLIKAGALHRANGGYLILDARKVLMQPYAWEGLKRALRAQEIHIESLAQIYSLISTISLDPEPIPLKVKVALLGERLLYYLLWQLDPDFAELFKVAVDFNEEMARDTESQRLYAQLLVTLIRKEELLHFDRGAVARVIERSARMVGDAEKLSTRMQNVTDLLRESDHWARQEKNDIVTARNVQQAIDAQIYRADRLRERMQEAIQRETILIDTTGAVVGQINGLAVLQVGDFAFARPSRITARVTLGKGQVVDIEREVELSGPLHSKGVLILSGFLKGRYAQDQPLSLAASLVFEQSYGGVDGDSASSAELYALLSAIADVGIKQSLAVTGSVNQRGQVQAIGGVNEKIEGFFDICAARGLTGEQGVLIPASNVKHLMLRQDVVEAVENDKFHVYAVETVDQGIELLTGIPAGEQDADGNYPEGSLNALVAQRLKMMAEKRQSFSEATKEESPT
ncbi:MAG: AAA family ATPase, partial [Anaerolineae bacterium]|nr:AAA family ATPase [Anaerolineae bacterium]